VKKTILVICVMVLAGALQSQMSGRMKIYGSAPDFLMAATMSMALVIDPALGAVFGFCAGVMHASIVDLSFGGFIISRTLLGFGMGWMRDWVFQENLLVLMAAALVGTIACEGIYFLIEPARSSSAAIAQLPMEAVYNALIALIFYLLVTRTLGREERTRPGVY
jgi:hypothetical protein